VKDLNEISVNFIDVGQGDCIALNWRKDNGHKGFGIIDCGNFKKSVSWFEKQSITTIDFLLLSHPHSDHFSGILKLLNYFSNRNVNVERIWITFNFGNSFLSNYGLTQEKFIGEMTYSNQNMTLLAKLLKEISDRKTSKESKIQNVGEMSCYELNSVFRLEFLGPLTYDSTKSFISTILNEKSGKIKTNHKNDFDNNPSANILSSSILISSNKGHGEVLLTSDIVSEEKERIFKEYNTRLSNLKLLQVPHHGSKNGFHKSELEKFVLKKDCYAVISVGPNIYGHPEIEVENYYRENFKDVFLTSEKSENNSDLNKNSDDALRNIDIISLDFLSEKNKNLSGTKSFIISKEKCKSI